MKAKLFNKLTLLFFTLPAIGLAATEEAESSTSLFSNALFNTMLVAIILLLIVNVVLAQALKNLVQSDYIINKARENKEQNTATAKTTGVIVLFSLMSFAAQAQTATTKNDWQVGGLGMWTFYSMLAVILLELIVMTVLLRLIQSLVKSDETVKPEVAPKENELLKKLTGAVAIENEEEIMLGHEYDGIRELDNDLPPWWKYGFYLTIMVAVVYLIHYHVARTGDLQITEYNKEVEKGKQEIAEFMKNAANNVDETNVKMLEGAELESGKQVFISTCAACHGKLGEGGVGPNLTDEYWVHGGGLGDIFKSIKYGWADKGMKSWKEDLSPVQIAQITSFIRSIKGTNPPNGKAPQGELYAETNSIPADSLGLKKDSTAIIIDTLKTIADGTKAK